MLGSLLALSSVVIVVFGSYAISKRFVLDPFFVLCASAYMGLLIAALSLDRARPGNEFGPLAEILFFFPIGFAFWIGGLVVLGGAKRRGERLGYFRTTLQSLTGLFYLGPLLAMGWEACFPPTNYAYDLIVELRAPKDLPFDPLTSVFVKSDRSESALAMEKMKQRPEGEFIVFSDSFPVEKIERQRILAVQRPNEPFQVFRLPGELKPQDWTQWERPDYLSDADAHWRLLAESEHHERTVSLPDDCFELRYRIEKRELEKWKPPR